MEKTAFLRNTVAESLVRPNSGSDSQHALVVKSSFLPEKATYMNKTGHQGTPS